mmetsp:Transcript_7022/g.11799  ORF Transcript_7022/g.11799 Transcript_7022/m.11799 type:complete len:230 (+) Transcript_7022:291-980(+)
MKQNQNIRSEVLKQMKETKVEDGPDPSSYNIKLLNQAPTYSFGTRFDSSIRSKNHLRPAKVDGPGPGSYKLPGSVQLVRRHPMSVNRTSFGTSGRQFIDLPKNTPAPNQYRPVHFTEASHSYSIPCKLEDFKQIKPYPGPGQYNNMKELKDQMHQAKSMLGGSTVDQELQDNGVPGPDAYQQNPIHKIPGFVIMQDTAKVKKEEDKNKKPVGPQTYTPVNPSHYLHGFN